MNNKVFQQPTDAELEILRILWENGPSTVRFVNEQLNTSRRVGYTTTLKIMQIMYDKGLVRRDEQSRSHVYSAILQKGEIQKRLVDKILEAAFGGSASRLIMQALGNHHTSPEELDEIRKLINELEKKKEP